VTDAEEQPPGWWDDGYRRKTEALEMSLRFVWACQRQIHRFADGLAARPSLYFDYSQGVHAPVDKQRIYELYRVDGYLVPVLAHQAVRWLRRAESEMGRDIGTRHLRVGITRQVGTLRDIYEHWLDHIDSFRDNTTKKRAGKRFIAENANYASPGEGWGIKVAEGPHLDNLKLNELFADLRQVEDSLLETQRELFAAVGLTVSDGGYQPLHEWKYFMGAVRVDVELSS
jgi:hypothetical protein